MKKFALSITAASIIAGGLAGCGADNQNADMGAQDTRNFGYEGLDQRGDTGQFGQRNNYRGEGPVTDMLTVDDRRTGDNIQRGTGWGAGMGTGHRMGAGNMGTRGHQTGTGNVGANRAGDGMGAGAGLGQGNRRGAGQMGGTTGFAGGDRTYGGTMTGTGAFNERRQMTHGMQNQLAPRTGRVGGPGMVGENGTLNARQQQRGAGTGAGITGQGAQKQQGQAGQGVQRNRGFGTQQQPQALGNYHQDYDAQTAQKISNAVEKMDTVNESRVIVREDDVLIGIDTTGINDEQKQTLGNRIERKVEQAFDGQKNVYVVSDEEQYTNVRNIDEQLRGGAPVEEVGETITDMIQDVANFAQRPFERSR